ncbi:MAG TPA: TlpA disulfide reductase family protein [Bryobacteraceae bacterium]|nr:TlpA disulfide reductase family protein [Bryobacteraceae bacterium]
MTHNKLDQGLKFAIAGLLGVLAWVIVYSMQEHIVGVGDTAPNFTVRADNGMQISRKNFGGKVLVLNFWATWCPPCVQEIPSLNEFQKMMAGSGVVVLGVSVDHNEKLYQNMLKKFDVTFPTMRDPDEKYSYLYGTYKVPETYIIDRNGKVVHKYIGLPDVDGVPRPWTDPQIVNYVKSLL